MDVKTIAFIGLGVMGEAMCRNLVKKGSWKVVGYDTKPEPMQRLKADGVTNSYPKDALSHDTSCMDCSSSHYGHVHWIVTCA